MDTFSSLNHLLNFVAPACFLATVFGLMSWLDRPLAWSWRRGTVRWVCVSVAGSAGLFAGLWAFGVDGKLASYALLVLACGTTQAVVSGHRPRR